MNNYKFPNHVAMIMDGNGRWAEKNGLARIFGHNAGMENLTKIIKSSIKFKIKYLTVYAFSTENWKRPKEEINFIFELLKKYINQEINNLIKNNVKVLFIGSKEGLSKNIVKLIELTEKKTQVSTGLILIIAFNYGGRKEILDTINFILKNKNILKFKTSINEEIFIKNLYTKNIPDPEILIRTSGECRLSNFLLWQLAYTEIFFSKKYWPDFNEKDYKKILIKYLNRKRRFGGI